MTLESCASFCSGFPCKICQEAFLTRGVTLFGFEADGQPADFGVEYARECYCGNSFAAGSTQAPATDCSMACTGNKFEYCGAGNRLSVYSKNGMASVSASSGRTASTANNVASTSASASPTPVVSTGLPSGWSYQGCWTEPSAGRALNVQLADDQQNTVARCAQSCISRGYNISGTEYGVNCFCGNALYNGPSRAPDSECGIACPGNKKEMCGAGGRLSVVANGVPPFFAPPSAQTSGLGTWDYSGCYTDYVNDQRTLVWQVLDFETNLTAKQCLDRCGAFGYMAAGLEYGEECYCGDPANVAARGSTLRPEAECNIACAGAPQYICGGRSRLSTYFWTGAPFYQWSFPQGNQAGQYRFLIGGVTVPLMTTQSITGKVTFVSKAGTGPGNETGSYELDLSVISDFARAWRPLHLKTDVFCSAGLVLPDKAGRQLTIGGWSGESTFGVRLYWPDGSAGVFGSHDWQENVQELSLQSGRWYPSAMILANGSILVMGGETGSNLATVPTIEILPPTGTPPLYMDWLERTAPDNLYPFCAVLPSGGIFVAYYNEARVLDEVTFDTIRTLPNMPTAVNDPMGGRTYPLEGTMVLLPQRAPYTDLLTVLVCGGSTKGVSNALDTCISINPDAAHPTWTIERMPSFRVMSCIAPLPDGTYLIANGAHHGVAGFGLATDPNLNALLYDPSRPMGSRISVMANTTVARLYHSEAITLLDGRVLISGSDPEDDINPQEYRVEVFLPPYLVGGKPRPSFRLTQANRDWAYGAEGIPFTVAGRPQNGAITVTLLGAVSTTHGNSFGARTLVPALSCLASGANTACTVDAPPNAHVAPPGWYQFFVLDGGIPAVGVYVRIGGDPAKLGNWPKFPDFTVPGV